MVQMLNSPQNIVREDPMMSGFSKIAEAIVKKMQSNQTAITEQGATNTEQMQKLIPELIKAGATPQEAVVNASKMVGSMTNSGDTSRPAMTSMPFLPSGIQMPNLANIAQNAWGAMQSPTYKGPDFTKMDKKFTSQKSLKDQGIKLPSVGGWDFSNMSTDELTKLAPIVAAITKLQGTQEAIKGRNAAKGKTSTDKGDPYRILAAKQLAKDISDGIIDPEDPEFDYKTEIDTRAAAIKGDEKPTVVKPVVKPTDKPGVKEETQHFEITEGGKLRKFDIPLSKVQAFKSAKGIK